MRGKLASGDVEGITCTMADCMLDYWTIERRTKRWPMRGERKGRRRSRPCAVSNLDGSWVDVVKGVLGLRLNLFDMDERDRRG